MSILSGFQRKQQS